MKYLDITLSLLVIGAVAYGVLFFIKKRYGVRNQISKEVDSADLSKLIDESNKRMRSRDNN